MPKLQITSEATRLLWNNYVRTGKRLTGHAAQEFLERKFNPYHDPEDGRFTFGPGSSSVGGSNLRGNANLGSPRYPVRIELPAPQPTGGRGRSRGTSRSGSTQYLVRIELPTVAPDLPAQNGNSSSIRPKSAIRFRHSQGLDLSDEVVTKANRLSDSIKLRTGYDIHVTSGRRGAIRQADAMYGNYSDGTPPRYANRAAEAEIHRVYREGRKIGMSRDRVVAAMAGVLSRQVAQGTFISRHMRSGAIDIRTPPSRVFGAIRNHPSVRSVGIENDHLHIEFK